MNKSINLTLKNFQKGGKIGKNFGLVMEKEIFPKTKFSKFRIVNYVIILDAHNL